jgi:hypothetical protein
MKYFVLFLFKRSLKSTTAKFSDLRCIQTSLTCNRNVDTTDLTDYSLLPNGLVFMSNTYSCFVLSRVENCFVIEPKNSKKQTRPGKRGNIIFICPRHAKII